MSSIAEAFPPDDPVARFVVSMAMAANDIEHALRAAGAANQADEPEFGYWVRLSIGHLFEAQLALNHWRSYDEVKKLLNKLPAGAKGDLKRVAGLAQKVGPELLEHNRHLTFHYPFPDKGKEPHYDQQLAKVMRELGEEEVDLFVRYEKDRANIRWRFADKVALAFAMREYDLADEEKENWEATETRDASTAFVRFFKALLGIYSEERGLELGDPEFLEDEA
jgi:hypothetical protein